MNDPGSELARCVNHMLLAYDELRAVERELKTNVKAEIRVAIGNTLWEIDLTRRHVERILKMVRDEEEAQGVF